MAEKSLERIMTEKSLEPVDERKTQFENLMTGPVIKEHDTAKKNLELSFEGKQLPSVKNKGPTSNDDKIINDPIHGHIQLERILIRIIDTPQFQRLRDIKQLGCTYRVFPGASHNRFEHAIGTCHLAGELVVHLAQSHEGDLPAIGPVDILCVKIAALCYNLGFGPFSHVFSEMCTEKVPEWNVEKASVVMFQHLIVVNNLKEALEMEGIYDDQLEFIKTLIDSSIDVPDAMKTKRFLKKVVRDPETSIDAVTMDSIARDSYLLNIPISFDHKRLVKFVRLNKHNEDLVLCYRDIEKHDLHSMCLSRLSLQTKAYKHKTVNILEEMVKQAFLKADEVLQLTATARDLLSDSEDRRIEAATKYTNLTDYVMFQIMERTEESLEGSKQIWRNIQTRKFMRLIGKVQTKSEQHNDFRTLELKLNELRSAANQRPGLKDCMMLVVVHCFGTKQCENPVEHVFFYRKKTPTIPIQLPKEKISKIFPAVFTDVFLYVYHECRDNTCVSRVFKSLISSDTDYSRSFQWIDEDDEPQISGPSTG